MKQSDREIYTTVWFSILRKQLVCALSKYASEPLVVFCGFVTDSADLVPGGYQLLQVAPSQGIRVVQQLAVHLLQQLFCVNFGGLALYEAVHDE